MANDVDTYNGISKALGECVVKMQLCPSQDDTSFEYTRRKLWCDVLMQGIEMNNSPSLQLADDMLNQFDKRFGKGDGE